MSDELNKKSQIKIETLADWWAKTNSWEAPFPKAGMGGAWSRDEIMGAFRVLDEIVPENLKTEAGIKLKAETKK